MAAEQEDEFSEEDIVVGDDFSEEDAEVAARPAEDDSALLPPNWVAPREPRPARGPPEAPDPGFWKSLGHSALSGFFKQGSDEAVGAVGRAVAPEAEGVGYRMPDGSTRYAKTEGDLYRAVRDGEREVLRGAQEHRPVLSTAANMAGDIASDMALQALGVPVATSAYQTFMGALGGLLGSDAELSTDEVKASDAASAGGSAAVGGALGYAMPKVGAAVARNVLPAVMPRVRQGLEDYAIGKGRRVLLNGADALAGNKELAPEAVAEALESGAIRPFGTTQSAYKALEGIAEIRGENYGEILRRLEAAGVQGPEVEALAQRFADEAADRWANSGANKSVADVFADEAANIRNVAPPAPTSFNIVAESPMAVTGPRLEPAPRGRVPKAPPPASGPVTTPVLTPPPTRLPPPIEALGGDPTKAMRPPAPDAPGLELPQLTPPRVPQGPMPPIYEPLAIAPPTHPLGQPIRGPQVERLPLGQAERIKRELQGQARWDRLRQTGLDEAKQEVSSAYRESIEDAIAEAGDAAPLGSEVAELADEFLPAKQQLSRTIAARDAAERGTAAAAKRRGISLTDYLSAGAAAGGGPAMQLLAAAGNNFARNRGTSAVAAGAWDASRTARRLARPAEAESFGNWLGAASGRQVQLDKSGGLARRDEAPGMEAFRQRVLQNPEAFGRYGPRLAQEAARSPEAFALHDWMLSQTDPDYSTLRRESFSGGQ